jgi:hypothetical protein
MDFKVFKEQLLLRELKVFREVRGFKVLEDHLVHKVFGVFKVVTSSPYPSWVLNTENYEWYSPIPEPELTEEQKES